MTKKLPSTCAVSRLVTAAKLVVSVYPYDWKACIKERKACRQCHAIAGLDAAVKEATHG